MQIRVTTVVHPGCNGASYIRRMRLTSTLVDPAGQDTAASGSSLVSAYSARLSFPTASARLVFLVYDMSGSQNGIGPSSRGERSCRVIGR